MVICLPLAWLALSIRAPDPAVLESAAAAGRSANRAVAARVLHNLGLLSATGNPAQAEAYLRREVEIEEELDGGMCLWSALNAHAAVLEQLGRTEEAQEARVRARVRPTPGPRCESP